MNKILNCCCIFDNLNEIVYATNLKTDEICYMNKKALNTFNISTLNDVIGKKAICVLTGMHEYSNPITNAYLETNLFYEIEYFNNELGKLFSLKDTIVEENGIKYKIEIAFDITTQAAQKKLIKAYANNEAILNRGLKIALSEEDPERSINVMLQYLGEELKSMRSYIFEKLDNGCWCNTYEWCARKNQSEMHNLQNVSNDTMKIWLNSFQQSNNIIIKDLEDTKESDPIMYSVLKPQGINTLVTCPIFSNNEIIGFFGVDNPSKKLLININELLSLTGHFMTFLLKRRDLISKLEILSFYDQLTGLKNRHAMWNFVELLPYYQNVGILFADVMGLKKINDSKGHTIGDELLINVANHLKKEFSDYEIFRIGGDEFVVICCDINEKKFTEKTINLKKCLQEDNATMAIGHLWYKKIDKPFNQVLKDVDSKMYEDKRKYYESIGYDRRRRA